MVQHVGTITAGTVAGKFQTATDDQGTGVADLATFTTVTTSTDAPNIQRAVVAASAIKGYVRYIGTIVTGPAQVSAVVLGALKTAS